MAMAISSVDLRIAISFGWTTRKALVHPRYARATSDHPGTGMAARPEARWSDGRLRTNPPSVRGNLDDDALRQARRDRGGTRLQRDGDRFAGHQAGTDTKKGTGHERERGRTTDG